MGIYRGVRIINTLRRGDVVVEIQREEIIMGMFDSLYVECTRCWGVVEFQSKVGICELHHYQLSDLPEDIAEDLLGQSKECWCGNIVTLKEGPHKLRLTT